jgi:hypothetical protein
MSSAPAVRLTLLLFDEAGPQTDTLDKVWSHLRRATEAASESLYVANEGKPTYESPAESMNALCLRSVERKKKAAAIVARTSFGTREIARCLDLCAERGFCTLYLAMHGMPSQEVIDFSNSMIDISKISSRFWAGGQDCAVHVPSNVPSLLVASHRRDGRDVVVSYILRVSHGVPEYFRFAFVRTASGDVVRCRVDESRGQDDSPVMIAPYDAEWDPFTSSLDLGKVGPDWTDFAPLPPKHGKVVFHSGPEIVF